MQPRAAKTQLRDIIKRQGGLYKSRDGPDSVIFSTYTNATCSNISCDPRRGLSVEITFDTPPGRGRDPAANKRAAHWESVGRKRLMQGGLVAFVAIPDGSHRAEDVRIYLGMVTSNIESLAKSAKQSPDSITIRVSFFETEAELYVLRSIQQGKAVAENTRLLLEAPVLFESIRPFLDTLKSQEPSSLPFARYLVHQEEETLQNIVVDKPGYMKPSFTLDLSVLFDVPTRAIVMPHNPVSVEDNLERLKTSSRLDPSQADALMTALTTELSLIQGSVWIHLLASPPRANPFGHPGLQELAK